MWRKGRVSVLTTGRASSRSTRRKAFIGEDGEGRRWLLVMALILFVLFVVVPAGSAVAPASAGASLGSANSPTARAAAKISPQVLQDTANGRSAELLVVMRDQADVRAAYSITDQDARGWYVYNSLRSFAASSQKDLRATLDARRIGYRSYWVTNALLVMGNRALVELLSSRDDVARVESNRPARWIEDPQILAPGPADDSPNTPSIIEQGVQTVRAPEVWELGYRGQGIVVGNLDTGVTWNHEALIRQYRGWNGSVVDHNYNWWDAIHSGGGRCGSNTQEPCDDVGHGTHTTGTSIGEDAAQINQIGVAPAARWLACRNMNVGVGTPASYTECFQFALAPTDLTGQNPRPDLRPHVLNNSWGCPPDEGCAAETLETIVENVQAAGIFVEASAGNSGPGCTTVNTPPALYGAAFTTGAVDTLNVLTDFSSRGPVTADGSNRVKPDIVAPGLNVRSAYGTGYIRFSGTSMAGPHVVGVVALLWSAHPELARQIAETRAILQSTANPNVTVSASSPYCGNTPPNQIPNNYFGYGLVDAYAAVQAAAQGTPTPVATATQASASPTPCGGSQVFTGDITDTDPTQDGILPRTGTSSSCTSPGVCYTPIAGARHYDLISIPNTTGTDRCVIIDIFTNCSGGNFIYSTAYLNSFDPNNICLNRLGEAGGSPYPTIEYSVMVPAGANLLIDVQEVNGGRGCPGYTVTVSGLSLACPSPSSTAVSTVSATASPTNTAISTPAVTSTATYTPTPSLPTRTTTPVPTATCVLRFTDVPPDHIFYPYVMFLACRGVISGYNDGTFRPNNDVTRGQLSKIITLSEGWAVDITNGPHFADVPPDNPFYPYIETIYNHHAVSGYSDGTFRWGSSVTRGQLSKIVVLAARWPLDTTGGPHFTDVPLNDTFYLYIETAYNHHIISGYEGGTFRPAGNATRGQIAKIVYLAVASP